MPDMNASNPTPQFSTLETSSRATTDTCKICKQSITGMYYRANGATVCGSCADRVKREVPQDSHAAFVRAVLFGLVGFAIGLALYAGFVIVTGISIGYVALAVGWIIGKAMMMGSNGVGGRRYQIVAVALTYAAVSIAFVPIWIYYNNKDRAEKAVTQQQVSSQSSGTEQSQNSTSDDSTEQQGSKMSFASTIGMLALWGLASPFLRIASNPMAFIGLIILFVGMQFAWKMTAGRGNVQVEGPYQLSSATSA
jgi:hypothetical protein